MGKNGYQFRAIPTKYDGHLFRSRLEARWAVFFQELEIPFEYESEGYEVASGVWYLPDFRLDNCYVEVKHRYDNDKQAPEKMGLLVAESRVPGVIVYGDPYNHLGVLFEPVNSFGLKYVRSVANFLNIRNSIQAATKARQAQFSGGYHATAATTY